MKAGGSLPDQRAKMPVPFAEATAPGCEIAASGALRGERSRIKDCDAERHRLRVGASWRSIPRLLPGNAEPGRFALRERDAMRDRLAGGLHAARVAASAKMLISRRTEASKNEEIPMYGELGLFIDGAWKKRRAPARARTSSIRRPRRRCAHLPHASKADLDEALEPPRRALRCGARPRPMTAARSCARPPT